MCGLLNFYICCIIAASVSAQHLDDYYYDSWDTALRYYPSYYSRNELEIGRTRLGEGAYRFLPGGRDVELRCDFPTHHIVSNIIWERVTDSSGRSFSYRSDYFADNRHADYDFYDARTAVLQRSEGASLFLRDVRPHDAGMYRCLASRRVPQSVGRWAQAVETVFQDVYFFPGGAPQM